MWNFPSNIVFLFLSFALITNQSIVNVVALKCKFFTSSGFTGLKGVNVYNCDVQNNNIFNRVRVNIDSANGTHKQRHSNANVNGLHLKSILSVKYLPQNLNKVFGDLILILLQSADLEEITQQDLKVFPNLQYINLFGNQISTIDKDLFKFNPKLKTIFLHNNQISHIDQNVFDHLSNLSTLFLRENYCKNALSDALNSPPEVSDLVIRVRNGECSTDNELEQLRNTVDYLMTKVEDLTKEINEMRKLQIYVH